MKLYILALALAACAAGGARAQLCAAGCSCTNYVMTCDGAALTEPPTGTWYSITNLGLAHNDISSLRKDALVGYPYLALLTLNYNGLEELDNEVFAAPYKGIMGLYASYNRISRVFSSPGGEAVPHLEVLILNHNRIESLDPDVLAAALPELRVLDLTDNPLLLPHGLPPLAHPQLGTLFLDSLGDDISVSEQTFSGLTNIRTLQLTSSGVPSVAGAFLNNPLLVNLNLTGNAITSLEADTFAKNQWLQSLVLSNNPLERVDVAALEGVIKSGGSITIRDTPLACNCAYDDLWRWGQGAKVTVHASCRGEDTCSLTLS